MTRQVPAPAQFIRPEEGGWQRGLLNLLLRVTVKWQLGLHVDVPALRARMARLNRSAPAQLPGFRRERVSCNGVAADWLVPGDCRPERVLLYLHGGAFVARTPELHAAMLAPWCRELKARVLMVDYRLAPEHPYPAAAQDCHAAYRWLLEQGVEAKRIVIAGDSAGGNLALATLQRLAAEGLPLPACAVLLSPFLDFTLSGRSALEHAKRDPVFDLAFAIGIRGCYARPEEYGSPGVSPLFGRFEGLPPLLLQVGSQEMLLDDSQRAAALATAAGVQARLEVWDRLPHLFQTITALPQARSAALRILAFIRTHAGW